MPRIVWKGAIVFGLVHVPVTLHPLSRDNDLDFDWIDRRDMAPVGYRRINKRTGREIEPEHVVKGYQFEKGRYVLLSDADFRAANPEATQTVDIEGFVEAAAIAPYYFQTPYLLVPARRGEKGYALLRETLRSSGRAGVAKVVIHARQHLAALLVEDAALVLVTMRFADEVLPVDPQALPPRDLRAVGVAARELEMARRLVDDMSGPWQPGAHHDTYRDDLLRRIDEKVRAGATHALAPAAGDAEPAPGAQVIDLMAALQQSLERSGRKGAAPAAARRRAAPAPPPPKARERSRSRRGRTG